jgi:outer membrane lipoprotein-sorting protein
MSINIRGLILFIISFALLTPILAQDATEIIRQARDHIRGESSYAEMRMEIIRPDWSREMQFKSWTIGDDLLLILITSPARDRGTAFLKRGRELYNWQPSIDRTIKMPPSMMMQSWMGSDFSNDDLVNQSSTVEDFTHTLLGQEEIEGLPCYVVELQPKPEAPVVWGLVKMWVSKEDYLTMKSEFYDEDNYLVHTMFGRNVRTFDGRRLPAILEVIPADEEGKLTRVEYLTLEFDIDIDESFFTQQNMKRL